MNVSLASEAELELTDGALFYAEQANVELGLAFIAEFEQALNVLVAHPNIGAPWRAKRRRFPLRRFPYNVIYYIKGEDLRVVALAHQRRKPGYWSRRR